jgi:hypothetical protein
MYRIFNFSAIASLSVLLAGGTIIDHVAAFEFDTLVFHDDFEAFDVGHQVSVGANEAPSTGIGRLWQYIGNPEQQATISSEHAFGEGTKSFDFNRPYTGIVPRYYTYPNVVPEATITPGVDFGIQYDLYVPQNPYVTNEESAFFGLSSVNLGLAPNGLPTTVGKVLSNGDGEVQVYDPVDARYERTGYFFGEGWHTVEIQYSIGEPTNNIAEAELTYFLTRPADNPAGELARTQIYQVYGNLTVGHNYRMDLNANGVGRFYLDNVKMGTLASDEILAGDYNEDGRVDAADYTVWRDKLGSTDPLPNDAVGGTIGQGQYDQWKANFGNGGAGSLAGWAVPEPSTLMFALFAGFGVLCQRRPHKASS